MLHPFCGYPLQRGTTFLAIVEIALAVLYLIQNAIGLWEYIPLALEERHYAAQNPTEKAPSSYEMKSVIILLNSAYWIGALLLGILLYFGSKQRDLRKCRQWFILTCILTVLFIVDTFFEAFSMIATTSEILSPVAASVLLTYMIWVVSEFMNELRLGGCVPMKSPSDISP